MKEYDPLHYDNLAQSIVGALLGGPEVPLPPAESFEGAGVYAIYYHGGFSGYSPIAGMTKVPPIYVGKAVPGGARKGGRRTSTKSALCQRLKEHSESIELAENLDLGDFTCRYLVVIPVWITLAERFLIEHYQPVWNVAIDGFGNHDPGSGRSSMKRPRWDILHPGRPWAAKLAAKESDTQVLERLLKFLAHPA